MDDMLKRYKEILNKIPKDLAILMNPHKEIVDLALKPGLISITWSSTNIQDCKNLKLKDKLFFC